MKVERLKIKNFEFLSEKKRNILLSLKVKKLEINTDQKSEFQEILNYLAITFYSSSTTIVIKYS